MTNSLRMFCLVIVILVLGCSKDKRTDSESGATETDTFENKGSESESEAGEKECPASKPAPGIPTEWIWENPSVQGNTLEAIWLNGSALWMAGEGATVVKRVGEEWSWETTLPQWEKEVSSTRVKQLTRHYTDIDGTDESNVWALYEGGIDRWNGSSWIEETGYPFETATAMAVCGAADVWVAGDWTIAHYDGTEWTKHSLGASQPRIWSGSSKAWNI